MEIPDKPVRHQHTMHDMLYAGWQGHLDSLAQQHQERLLMLDYS